MILKCSCQGFGGSKDGALSQDAMYGEGQRAHNPTAKENQYRCTVCGNEKGGPSKKSKKEEAEASKEDKKKLAK